MIIALQTLLFLRESLVTLIERFLGPYYRRFSLKFNGEEGSDDEDSNDDVFAEYDDEKGVVFYPPVYAQRYAAVSDCLMDKRWCGKLEKVVDFGCHDMSFIKYLKDVPGIKHILGVDIETIPLKCSSQLLMGSDSYAARTENPLKVTLFQGNAADPDYRLIGCDAVVSIEMIEHMLPHDLERLVHTVFGFIKPWVAIFTTPNGDFNVLFKALEKNGLRRLDHMFEWSQEQFHEWCSNIVARYPDYTVTCKGIGPGPPDTIHLGCCSQLALFVAKDYIKQPDLDLNSLALVAKTSCQNDVSHLIGSWESGDSLTENDMLCAPSSIQSFPELMYGEPSYMSILATPISNESIECKEKTFQCNLDSEIGKNFLMFDYEEFSKVLLPRKEKHYRVYEIEDVISRLNCSTFQVKKFSKAAHNLMAKNKMDSYEHTREVVSEIRHLMKMLNFNKDRVEGDLEGAWCNINWGTNAPYWNQYYKIVEEYNYPHEGKNDDTSILDLISGEINRLIDTQYDEEFTSDMHKLEIPIDQLMPVVEHITRDVHRVRELLEWNGYEVADDRVIHSRVIVDSVSETSAGDDWQEDTVSDWDTRVSKVPSTTFSDGSTIAPDYYEPHTKEPSPAANISDKGIVSTEMKVDSTSELIVPKYQNFEVTTDRQLDFNGDPNALNADDFKFDNYKISVSRTPLKDDENNNNDVLRVDPNEQSNIDLANKQSDTCCLELVPYNSSGRTADEVKFEESTCKSSNGVVYKDKELEELNGSRLSTQSKILPETPRSATRVNKKKSSRRPSYLKLMKFSFAYNKYKSSERKKPKDHQMLIQSTPSRPIPASLIELCDSQSNKNWGKNYSVLPNYNVNGHCQPTNDIAATEECMFIGIVTEDGEETIAMRRHIGISPEFDVDTIENEDLLQSVVNLSMDDSFSYETNIDTENIQSQTIFLYDLEEPSTSKGVRHLSADVQCGPDVTTTPSMLSQTTNFERLPKLFTTGIKIEEPKPDVMKSNKITSDFGTCTDKDDNTVTIGRQSVGIKNKESIQNVIEYCTTEQVVEKPHFCPSKFDQKTESKLLKPVSSSLKINDSGLEFCGSVGRCAKSPIRLVTSFTNTSDFQMQSLSNEKNVLIKISQASCNRRNLACGGVHVHSFKERQVSEDVVYLGEWQKEHKVIRSSIIRKNIPLPKRPRLHLKEHTIINKITNPSKKTISVTKPQYTLKNREKLNKPDQNKNMNSTTTVYTRKISNTKKVAPISKYMPISSQNISNNLKTIYTKRKTYNAIEKYTKREDEHLKIKNYLPLYLLRKRKNNIMENKNKRNLNSGHIEKENSTQDFTGKITRDLINIPEKKLVPDMNYMVFRNEIQSEKDTNIHSPVAAKNDTSCRSHSPQSQHSSTCSSPNSVSTVRAVSTRNRVSSNRRNSTSSDRSSSGILESDNKTQKCKKFSQRGKNNKKPPTLSNVLSDNKENFPESSKNSRRIEETLHKNNKAAKNVFLEGTKSVLVAQVTTETSTIPLISTNISKTRMQCKSKTIKLANIRSRDDEAFKPPSSSVFDSSLDKNPTDKETENISSTSVPDENNDFVYESFTASLNNSFESDSYRSSNEANNASFESQKSVHSTKSSIISAIRKLIEHKLNLPENSYRSYDSDSETVILSRDDNYYNVGSPTPKFDTKQSTNEVTFRPESDEDRSSIHCSYTTNENNTLPCASEVKSQNLESDALSLKSFASVSTSRFSEYYLADNELESTITEADRLNISSVQEIFERKELNAIPNAGALAIQAFSGFSVNEPITGDQPDFVNFIDSETGSFAFELARQTASEEIFVSGRSSDTYESCYVDDDAYVPNWLFNMISQQHSAEDSEAEEINLPVLPIVEPDHDMNGNVMEPGVGVGAGAGDGRGMHSDHSQDSSGRGSSLSSSETSSGLQSEVILSNPSNITAQEDHLREPINMSSMMEPSRPTASTPSNPRENNSVETSSHQNRIPSLNPAQVTSDVDADISSLETDAVDSDN